MVRWPIGVLSFAAFFAGVWLQLATTPMPAWAALVLLAAGWTGIVAVLVLFARQHGSS